jgi:hypothetical protein
MQKGKLIAEVLRTFLESEIHPFEIKKKFVPKLLPYKEELLEDWKEALKRTTREKIWIHTYHNAILNFLGLTGALNYISDFPVYLAQFPIPIQRAVVQTVFSWFAYDISRDLFKLQMQLKQPYTDDGIRETLILGFLTAGVNRLVTREEFERAIKQGVEFVKGFFDNGYGEFRSIVLVEDWQIVYISLYNKETINWRKPAISLVDVLTLPEEKLKEKEELAKLGMPTEIINYGIGLNLKRPDYTEYGNIPIDYFSLLFPFGAIRAGFSPEPTIEVFD